MRKLMSILLCFLLLFSLAACADNGAESSSAIDTSSTDSTGTSTTTTTASSAVSTSESTQDSPTTTTGATKPSTTTAGTTTTTTKATTTTTKPVTPTSAYMQSDEDVLKTYFTGSAISKTHFMASAGYMVDGVVKDTMFESFAFTPTPAYVYQSGGGFITKKSQWQSMIDEMFLSGKNMDALNEAVGEIKTQLKLSGDYKVKVYLPLLCAVKKDTEFGEVNGKTLNFSSDADRLEAVKWLAQEELRVFKSKNYKNIEIGGLYWFKEEIEPVTEAEHVKQVCQYAHSLKYDIIWSPYYQAKGYANWKEYGFDRISMQANYFPGVAAENAPNNGTIGRLSTIATTMKNRQIGIEMELGSSSKNSITGFKQYMQAGVEKGYMNTYHVWYLVNGPSLTYNLYHSKDAYTLSAYTDMYKFIKGTLTLAELTIQPLS